MSFFSRLFGKKAPEAPAINTAYLELVKTHDYSVLPEFICYPGAYRDGVFKEEPGECECCGKEVPYVYTGVLYSEIEEGTLCPWCVASGAAAMKYDGFFNEISGHAPEERDELVCKRTPKFTSWQDISWATHCDDAAIFRGTQESPKDWKRFRQESPDAKLEIDENYDYTYDDPEEIGKNLNGSFIVHLFQCAHCGTYILSCDCD